MTHKNAEPMDESPIWPLVQTVFTSIVEVFLTCLFGYILASRGILDKKFQKQLNRLNVSLFTPSLLFSKVAFFLSPAKLKELWIIPIFFLLVTSISMLISFILGWMFRLKRSQRSFAMAAAMFMNSNSLPIAMMQSLVITVPGLKWGENDSKDAMVGRALTYLVLYSTLGMVLRWSYGVRLLAQADDEPAPKDTDVNERTPLLSSSETAFPPNPRETRILRHHSSTTQVDVEEGQTVLYNGGHTGLMPDITVHAPKILRPPPPRRKSTFIHSFPNSPQSSQVFSSPLSTPTPVSPSSSDSETDSNEEEEDGTLPVHIPRRRRSVTVSASPATRSFLHRSKRFTSRAWANVNEFMTVPLWAALASIVVACVRPIQHALESHMQPVKGALAATGNCSIPVTLIVLGAYFHQPPSTEEEAPVANGHTTEPSISSRSSVGSFRSMFKMTTWNGRRAASKNEKRTGETKTVVIAVLSRMIFTPMLLLPLLAISTKFDLHAVFEDPVFVVANVLLVSSPPALTLAQITQAASGDAFERLISRTIFWAYCIVTPPATIIYVVIGLVLSKL